MKCVCSDKTSALRIKAFESFQQHFFVITLLQSPSNHLNEFVEVNTALVIFVQVLYDIPTFLSDSRVLPTEGKPADYIIYVLFLAFECDSAFEVIESLSTLDFEPKILIFEVFLTSFVGSNSCCIFLGVVGIYFSLILIYMQKIINTSHTYQLSQFT